MGLLHCRWVVGCDVYLHTHNHASFPLLHSSPHLLLPPQLLLQTESPFSPWDTWPLNFHPRIWFPVTHGTKAAVPEAALTGHGGFWGEEGKFSLFKKNIFKMTQGWEFFSSIITLQLAVFLLLHFLILCFSVVTEECYPFNPPQQTPAEVNRCMMQSRSVGRGKRQATAHCPNAYSYHNEIYQSTPPYRLSANVRKHTPMPCNILSASRPRTHSLILSNSLVYIWYT